jgi:hypothetical protein
MYPRGVKEALIILLGGISKNKKVLNTVNYLL